MRKLALLFFGSFLLLVLVVFVYSLTSISLREPPLTYSELEDMVHSGHGSAIEKVTMVNGDSVIRVKIAHIDRDKAVTIPIEKKQDLINELKEAGVQLELKDR